MTRYELVVETLYRNQDIDKLKNLDTIIIAFDLSDKKWPVCHGFSFSMEHAKILGQLLRNYFKTR